MSASSPELMALKKELMEAEIHAIKMWEAMCEESDKRVAVIINGGEPTEREILANKKWEAAREERNKLEALVDKLEAEKQLRKWKMGGGVLEEELEAAKEKMAAAEKKLGEWSAKVEDAFLNGNPTEAFKRHMTVIIKLWEAAREERNRLEARIKEERNRGVPWWVALNESLDAENPWSREERERKRLMAQIKEVPPRQGESWWDALDVFLAAMIPWSIEDRDAIGGLLVEPLTALWRAHDKLD